MKNSIRCPKSVYKFTQFVNWVVTGEVGMTVCTHLYISNKNKPSRFNSALLSAVDMIFWFDKKHTRKSFLLWKKGKYNE
jgi:hypothetical protein